jgi:hypothetical protein
VTRSASHLSLLAAVSLVAVLAIGVIATLTAVHQATPARPGTKSERAADGGFTPATAPTVGGPTAGAGEHRDLACYGSASRVWSPCGPGVVSDP